MVKKTPRTWLAWKLHRLVLKKSPLWRRLRLPGGRLFWVRHLAEGCNYYVFRVRGRLELLKVLRAQFYEPHRVVGADEVRRGAELLNSLAERGLAPAATWLDCGAYLVEDAGQPLLPGGLAGPEPLRRFFADLRAWSLETELVLLDYNEDNWCRDPITGAIKLVDVEPAFTCPLAGMAGNEIVRRRLDPALLAAGEPARLLEAFLAAELDLLWCHLRQG